MVGLLDGRALAEHLAAGDLDARTARVHDLRLPDLICGWEDEDVTDALVLIWPPLQTRGRVAPVALQAMARALASRTGHGRGYVDSLCGTAWSPRHAVPGAPQGLQGLRQANRTGA